MHAEAWDWISDISVACRECVTGLDVGGTNVNGCARELFPHIEWVAVDRDPSEGVVKLDWLSKEAEAFIQSNKFDLVTCFEVLEHVAEDQMRFLHNLYQALKPGGVLLLTCGTTGRVPHNCSGAQPCTEPYRNAVASEIVAYLENTLHVKEYSVVCDFTRGDLYLFARK